MGTTVTGTPLGPFGDALYRVSAADGTLAALAHAAGATVGVYASLPRDRRVPFPYIIIGRRGFAADAGAMQREGGTATVWLDIWSDQNGPGEVHDIQARLRVLFQRQSIAVSGFA